MVRLGFVLLALLPAARAQEPTRNVLLLLKTQLLEDAGAYGRFTKEHERTGRTKLRADVVARLKAIAAKEQAPVLRKLGKDVNARSLWVVNAIAAPLTATQIKAVAPMVKHVYPAGRFPERARVGQVSEVLKPAARAPFTTKKKKVAWNLAFLKAPDVWKKLKVTGEGVVVAMLDAGVNYKHTDLRGNVWINAKEIPNNGKDDDGNGLVDDLYGFDFGNWTCEVKAGRIAHGTFTSCVVAGDGTGGLVTGMAPRARLMILRAQGGPYAAARAFQYALDNGADVMSMSFSIPGLGHTRGLWRLMAEHATCAGLVLVSGAGNFPREPLPRQIRIPEGIPCVVCAGGVTKKKEFPNFLSQGPVTWANVKFYNDYPMPKGLIKPDVCGLPGPRIGLVAAGDEGYLPDSNRKRGNSLSAPHVAGGIALMLSANKELTPWRVKELLERTATDVPPRGKDNQTGAGILHAFRAVKAAQAERK